MRVLFIISVLFIQVEFIRAQSSWQNLVPNYSFENVSLEYPLNYNPGDGYGCSVMNDLSTNPTKYGAIENYWGEINSWTHPLRRYFWCTVGTADLLTFEGSPCTPFGCAIPARSGIRKGYGTTSEYHVVELKEPLSPSKSYFFECFSGNTGKKVTISDERSKQKCSGGLVGSNIIYQTIMTLNDNVAYEAGSNFVRGRAYFSPLVESKWLTIGSEDGGGYIDDVRIYELTENLCRDNWYFDNTVFNYPVEIFRATNGVYIGEGTDPESNLSGGSHISGSVKALAGSNTVVKASNEILITKQLTIHLYEKHNFNNSFAFSEYYFY